MQPEKYLDDLESSERRKGILTDFTVALIFATCFIAVGPFLHELSHMAVLELYSCGYTTDIGFDLLGGVYAGVNPLCTIQGSKLAFFYAAGYLSTFLIGGSLSAISVELEGPSRLTASAASGLLLSILVSVGRKGDIQNMMSSLQLPEFYAALGVAAITVIVFTISLGTVQVLLSEG